MREFFTSIWTNIKNRIGSPFLSATLFAYIVIHWKLFYVTFLFGDSQFKYGDKTFLNSLDFIIKSNYNCWYNIGYPLLFGLGYAIVTPLITNSTKVWDRKVFDKFKNWFKVIIKKTVTEDEYDNLVKELNDKDSKIQDVKKQKEEFRSKLDKIEVEELRNTVVDFGVRFGKENEHISRANILEGRTGKKTISFKIWNQDIYLSHRNFEFGYKYYKEDENETRIEDSTFFAKPALSINFQNKEENRDNNIYSFESYNHRHHYLIRRDNKIRLEKYEDNDEFKENATFIIEFLTKND